MLLSVNSRHQVSPSSCAFREGSLLISPPHAIQLPVYSLVSVYFSKLSLLTIKPVGTNSGWFPLSHLFLLHARQRPRFPFTAQKMWQLANVLHPTACAGKFILSCTLQPILILVHHPVQRACCSNPANESHCFPYSDEPLRLAKLAGTATTGIEYSTSGFRFLLPAKTKLLSSTMEDIGGRHIQELFSLLHLFVPPQSNSPPATCERSEGHFFRVQLFMEFHNLYSLAYCWSFSSAFILGRI